MEHWSCGVLGLMYPEERGPGVRLAREAEPSALLILIAVWRIR
jgi:hypothetical protein